MSANPHTEVNMSAPLSAEDVDARLASALPRWAREGDQIVRRVKTENWKATLLLANAIGHLAEVAWHHPQLVLDYAALTIRLSTHSAGGITDQDFALAEKIEALLGWRPGAEGGPLEGTPDTPEHRYLRD